jgi:site-specific DNA-methyltransferase (adenine-specific)
MESAVALAHKKDDRTRKEFEKWAVLTYTNNHAIINEKKGADGGIDARSYFATGKDTSDKIVYQVKSGKVGRKDIAALRGDMEREGASMAVFITLEEHTKPMTDEAKKIGKYHLKMMGRSYDRISIVTIKEILDGRQLEVPHSLEVLKAAEKVIGPRSRGLFR